MALDCGRETELMRQEYEKRRNLLVEGMKDIPGVEFLSPSGAFYAWVKFDTEQSSDELCRLLLESAKIAGVPGTAYGETDHVCIRFSYAASEQALKQMLINLKKFMSKK